MGGVRLVGVYMCVDGACTFSCLCAPGFEGATCQTSK